MTEAPYHEPDTEALALWVSARDGRRLRVTLWPAEGARATALIFSGRCEHAEKWGIVARGLAKRGLASAMVDWRGQGLSDRLTADPMIGHVERFSDYQLDVAALLETVEASGLPPVTGLVAHSMGGAIGLRALLRGLPVKAALFSAPMWGIGMATAMRPVAWTVSNLGVAFGLGLSYLPFTSRISYVANGPFEGNTLTRDREMWDRMVAFARSDPRFALGGPSIHWLHEALAEVRSLRAARPPALPAMVLLGSEEVVVEPPAVRGVAKAWPTAELEHVEGARHELFMELPEVRDRALDRAAELFL